MTKTSQAMAEAGITSFGFHQIHAIAHFFQKSARSVLCLCGAVRRPAGSLVERSASDIVVEHPERCLDVSALPQVFYGIREQDATDPCADHLGCQIDGPH